MIRDGNIYYYEFGNSTDTPFNNIIGTYSADLYVERAYGFVPIHFIWSISTLEQPITTSGSGSPYVLSGPTAQAVVEIDNKIASAKKEITQNLIQWIVIGFLGLAILISIYKDMRRNKIKKIAKEIQNGNI